MYHIFKCKIIQKIHKFISDSSNFQIKSKQPFSEASALLFQRLFLHGGWFSLLLILLPHFHFLTLLFLGGFLFNYLFLNEREKVLHFLLVLLTLSTMTATTLYFTTTTIFTLNLRWLYHLDFLIQAFDSALIRKHAIVGIPIFLIDEIRFTAPALFLVL